MFPEVSRVLALKGAELIVLPTNWPELGQVFPDCILPARAFENQVFCIGVNRVGEERGIRFFGRSKIAHWSGLTLAQAKSYEEDIIYAEIEPTTAREKYQVVIPGEFEVHIINDRRPEFYGHITQSLTDTSRIRP
jgi:predicted amidohydrolase